MDRPFSEGPICVFVGLMIDVTIIPTLKDNYAYLLVAEGGAVAVVDPGEAEPVQAVLLEKGLGLDYVLNTHHHGDHIAGNAALIEAWGAKLVGPRAETDRIPGMDILLDEGTAFSFGGEEVQVIETPGHTRGHICFYFPDSGVLFTGDTLFLMGCGRLFEGSAEEMFKSLSKIKALPDDTHVYCGHEYTVSGAQFCHHVLPDNDDIRHRLAHEQDVREAGQPTVPAALGLEKKTNVFLLVKSADELAAFRRMKDEF